MKRYRIREGSAADLFRIVLTAVAFWAVIFEAIVTTYPV